MPNLMRHTRMESSRLANGNTGIHGVWVLDTVAGTSTYKMWDAAYGCPFQQVEVIRASLIVGLSAAADTVVIQHVDTAGTANAMTDTANLALFAQDNQVDFSDILRFSADYSTINRGENMQVVTASGALARVFVEYVVVGS